MRRDYKIERPLAIQRWLSKDLSSPAQDPLPVMGVANLATERGMRAVTLAPMMSGQEPLLRGKKQRKEAQIPLKGEGLKEEREKGIPLSEMQGKTIRRKGSASTSPEAMGIASSGMRAALSTKVPKEEEEQEANEKGTLPYSLPTPTRRRSPEEIKQRAGRP